MTTRVLIAGAAGLVGQNLIAQLERQGGFELIAVDKHEQNTALLRRLHPGVRVIEADLAEGGAWEAAVADCQAVVMLQAQIGGLDAAEFEANNIAATRRILDACARSGRPYLVHVSSSVVNSAARDLYTESKKRQEALVSDSGLPHVILRPTLMFGWFDRKHLGWLRWFMRRAPVFPVPGSGRYARQPLYAGDFAGIVRACLERNMVGVYNISGLEQIDYIDLIRLVREVDGQRTPILSIPAGLFAALLRLYAAFLGDPPFTVAQLRALMTPDLFEIIDWPSIFGVPHTPLKEALTITFRDPSYGELELAF